MASRLRPDSIQLIPFLVGQSSAAFSRRYRVSGKWTWSKALARKLLQPCFGLLGFCLRGTNFAFGGISQAWGGLPIRI
jgi:hypothetical protein